MRPLHKPELFSEFSQWLNALRNSELNPHRYAFSFTDGDGFFFQDMRTVIYSFHLEVKSRGGGGAEQSAQKTAHSLIESVFRFSSGQSISFIAWGRPVVKPHAYYGFHFLVLSGKTPDDSEWMRWDDKPISRQELIEVLRFERNPFDMAAFL